jgi:hypothetical protein
MGADSAAIAEFHLRANHGIGTDLHISAEAGARIDHCRGMDLGSHC